MDGYIHSEPMSSRHHTSYIAAFERTIDFFTKLGRPPTFLRLDNETFRPLDTDMSRKGIAMQYCPPGMHRANKAERSIQTFKNHAISTFCTTATDFPLTLWDKLLPQIELSNHINLTQRYQLMLDYTVVPTIFELILLPQLAQKF